MSGEVDVYRALLPERSDQFVLRSHHIASQLDSADEYDAVMAGYRQRGHRIALEARFGEPGSSTPTRTICSAISRNIC